MKKNRILSIVLLGSMIFGILSGCKEDKTGSSSTPTEQPVTKEPFVLADTVENLAEGGDFAGEKSPMRANEKSEIYTGSSHGSGDNKCIRATGTAYAIFKKSDLPAGKYVTRFWLRDNGAANDSYVTIYVNSMEGEVFRSDGTMTWQQFMSQVIEVEDGATISVRLDVVADNVVDEKVIVELDDFYFERIPYDYPDVVTGENPVSYLKKVDDKTNVICVGGENKFIKSCFADDLDVSKFKENGFNAFTYTVSAEDDVSKIDAAIETAVENGLYLQVFYKIRGTDCQSEADLEADKAALAALMARIAEKDTNRIVISLNISNIFLNDLYKGVGMTHVKTVRYMDELAKVVKTSQHPMIVSVSVPNDMPNFIYNTEYIDYNCSEFDTTDMSVVAQAINDQMSRLGAVAKVSGKGDISPMLMSAYAKNGYVAASDIDNIFSPKELHNKIGMIEGLLLKATSENKASFNTDGAYNKEYTGRKELGPVTVKFEAYIDNGPVGIAVLENNAVYCIADKPSFFSIYGVDGYGVLGAFDENGVFVADEEHKITSQEAMDGSYRCEYAECDVLKLDCYLVTVPEVGGVAEVPIYNAKYATAKVTPLRENLVENGNFEDGYDPFTWKSVGQPMQISLITNGQSVQDMCGLQMYSSGGSQNNAYGYINLGALPAGTYGFMAYWRGGRTIYSGNGNGIWFELKVNNETYKKYEIERDKVVSKTFTDVITITEKSIVQVEIRAELAYGAVYGFVDCIEFVRLG